MTVFNEALKYLLHFLGLESFKATKNKEKKITEYILYVWCRYTHFTKWLKCMFGTIKDAYFSDLEFSYVTLYSSPQFSNVKVNRS